MKSLLPSWLWFSILGTIAAHAQLEILPEAKPLQVFGGGQRPIKIVCRNRGQETAEINVRLRLYQTTSATAVPLSEKVWKNFQVLPGQSLLETAPVDFPEVKAETPFLIQWARSSNEVVGKTEVLVYPPDLLKQLKPMIEEESLGVFDPQNQIKPVLQKAGVKFTDLEDAGLEGFSGKLAIAGPFDSKAPIGEGLPGRIEALAAKGVAVVWIQPPPERREKLKPSFYTVDAGKAAVVIVQADLVADLAERPQSQLNLIHFARLALHPEPARLPHSTSQP